jgi:uncharacterized membrane protein
MGEGDRPSERHRDLRRGGWAVALVLGVGSLAVVLSEMSGRAAAVGAVAGIALVYALVEYLRRRGR